MDPYELDTFTRAYAEAALWSSLDENGTQLDEYLSLTEIAPETLEQMLEDCRDFCEANAELLAQAGDDERNGHDFWLTRNRHGAGFWDRGYGPAGDALTKAAHVYGSLYLYLGDDGKVHQS